MSQYWSFFDELPKELQENIEQLLWDMEHKEKFSPLLKKIQLKAVQTKMDNLYRNFRTTGNDDSFMSFLKDNLNDKEKMVEVLRDCKCCKRHQKNKPNHLNDWVLNFNPKETEKNACKCSCRQHSRMICCSILI